MFLVDVLYTGEDMISADAHMYDELCVLPMGAIRQVPAAVMGTTPTTCYPTGAPKLLVRRPTKL